MDFSKVFIPMQSMTVTENQKFVCGPQTADEMHSGLDYMKKL